MTSKQAQWIKQYESLGGSIGISFGGPTAGGAYTTP